MAPSAPENCWATKPGAYGTGQYVLVTRDNIEVVKDSMAALDQRAELAPGCVTWAIYYEPGSQRGQMTVWPNGRGAIARGGDSIWGDWDDTAKVLVCDADEGVYDEDGDLEEEHP